MVGTIHDGVGGGERGPTGGEGKGWSDGGVQTKRNKVSILERKSKFKCHFQFPPEKPEDTFLA